MARSNVVDLNQLSPTRAAKGSSYDWDKRDRGAKSGTTRAHLGDIAEPLEQFLRDSEAVVGCVAWITSRRLVAALHNVPVSIIVNKEWNLRLSDAKVRSSNPRELFAQLSGGIHRSDSPAPLCQVAGAPDDSIDPVRCAGHLSRSRGGNSPLMHHKFAVRLRDGNPVAVWTGSFNFTHNAETSFENAIEIHDPVIARAYYEEWARVAALSEPLDFAAGKADPSWSRTKEAPAAPPATVADRPVKRRPARKPAKPAPAKGRAAPVQAAPKTGASAKPRAAAKPRVVTAKPRAAVKPRAKAPTARASRAKSARA